MSKLLQSQFAKSVWNNDLPAAAQMLDSRVDPNFRDEDGDPPLVGAVYAGEEMVALLLLHGADPNFLSENGCSALYFAILHKDLGVMKELLKFGADMCTGMGGNDENALHTACRHGNPNVLQVLAVHASPEQLNRVSEDYVTPLMFAILQNRGDLVNILIRHGADVDMTTPQYMRSPLHLAVREDNPDIVQALVKAGADKTSQDYLGRRPIEVIPKDSKNAAIIRTVLE